jgi:hypothetical protein
MRTTEGSRICWRVLLPDCGVRSNKCCMVRLAPAAAVDPFTSIKG